MMTEERKVRKKADKRISSRSTKNEGVSETVPSEIFHTKMKTHICLSLQPVCLFPKRYTIILFKVIKPTAASKTAGITRLYTDYKTLQVQLRTKVLPLFYTFDTIDLCNP